jgi:hypothetical protein
MSQPPPPPPKKHTYRHLGLDDARTLDPCRGAILPEGRRHHLQVARAVAAAQLGRRRARLAGLALCVCGLMCTSCVQVVKSERIN